MFEGYSIRNDLLSPLVASWLLGLMFLAGVALWIGVHVVAGRRRARFIAFAGGSAVGTLAVWLFFQLLGRFILPGCAWPLWVLAAIAAVSVETVIAAYRYEWRTMGRWRGGRMIALRLALLAVVVLILFDPVMQIRKTRSVAGTVAVLVDGSESMYVTDSGLTLPEKLDMASLFDRGIVKGRVPGNMLVRQVRKLADDSDLLRQVLTVGTGAGSGKVFLTAVLKQAEQLDSAVRACEDNIKSWQSLKLNGEPGKEELQAIQEVLDKQVKGFLKETFEAAKDANLGAVTGAVSRISHAVERVRGLIPGIETAARKADDVFYASLQADQKKKVDQAVSMKRMDVAGQILGLSPDSDGILKKLESKYAVRLVKFGSSPAETLASDFAHLIQLGQQPVSEARKTETQYALEMASRKSTDITAALEYALKEIPSETLCGMVLLTDGRHNGDAGVDAVSRRLGTREIPVYPIVIGGQVPPADAAVVAVHAPESIFLGDRVAVKTDIKVDGFRGKKVTVRLMLGEASVSDKTLDVAMDHFMTEVRFVHTPEGQGVFRYSVVVDPVGDEKVKENNVWAFDVAVSADRTNVLLIDGRPRWEFRYLRNLFFGRDKSVHLQYLLLDPDKIAGIQPPAPVAASASRKFGDAEATLLPVNEDEWQKFDVIILGDIPPTVLDDKTVAMIHKCVAERGALLVVISGQRYMPHAFSNPVFRDILPVRYAVDAQKYAFTAPEPEYRFLLSPEGRNHIIMQQSPSQSENLQIWGGLPNLHWRHTIESAKEGATVLAYAEPLGGEDKRLVAAAGDSMEFSAAMLARQAEVQKRNALIAAHRFAEGRVVMLMFDETWRLRYKVGDTYHHRFWGQVLRWGASENLRAGNNSVRLGSDKISYSPADGVHVVARVFTEDLKPVNNDSPHIEVLRGNEFIVKKKLEFREGSAGIYETVLDPVMRSGRYRMILRGAQADRIIEALGGGNVETEFVVTAESPVEMSDLSASAAIPSRVAELSGGALLGMDQVSTLDSYFGPGRKDLQERKSVSLWDKWWTLLIVAALVSAEWLLRKKGGLA